MTDHCSHTTGWGETGVSGEMLAALLPGTPLRVLEETGSTNVDAKHWALEGARHGSLVVAAHQSAGRGRLGRSFASPPGGVYMSAILRPSQPPETAMMMTTAAAVAVYRAVRDLCGLHLGIKWVNDLFWQNKKCCGILTEATGDLENHEMASMVVGIGINYTTPAAVFPPELAAIATSLYPEGPPPATHMQLVAAIHQNLLALSDALPATDFLVDYRARSLALGHEVTVLAQEPYVARAVEVDDAGRLVVETAAGERRVLTAGEISVRL